MNERPKNFTIAADGLSRLRGKDSKKLWTLRDVTGDADDAVAHA